MTDMDMASEEAFGVSSLSSKDFRGFACGLSLWKIILNAALK